MIVLNHVSPIATVTKVLNQVDYLFRDPELLFLNSLLQDCDSPSTWVFKGISWSTVISEKMLKVNIIVQSSYF